jgi:hypothetical protein
LNFFTALQLYQSMNNFCKLINHVFFEQNQKMGYGNDGMMGSGRFDVLYPIFQFSIISSFQTLEVNCSCR